ncbi:MAG TPA: xanthine dehydrogenase family protein molybdopterin-binding subunit [Streptosporangiaceae bacterium]|nr:xanthine dehydrogenase family protein molybdopterin-binding subunit [Streptosporangiaceae bacterium]
MPSRLDGPPKVTGRAKYGADHNLPGMVHGYIVVSTIAHGEIRAVDVTAAMGAPGVIDVYSPFRPLDLRTPNTMFGETWVPLQDKEVAYYGQPIGLVVAETYEQARDAAMTIGVSYHERPALTSLLDGISAAQDAPPGFDGSPSTMDILAPGVASIEDALRASPVVVEATYATATQHHAAMEPHSAVAAWDSDGLTVYSGNQGSNLQAMELAAALEVDVSSVHALNPFVGGAFGGKARTSAAAFLAAAAARAIGRPVKVVLSREQVFTATAGRAATIQKVALGATQDGSLIAIRHDAWSSTAADRSFVEPASHSTREYYKAENLSISQKMVPLNIPPGTFMRAPGEATGSFALESAIDELAVALNMDPIQLRMRNDSTAPLGKDLLWSGKHLDECFRIGAARFGWSERTPHGRTDGDWLVGLGVATAMFPALRFPASVRVTLRDDDTAEVATSGADPGTGLLTVLSLVGAESLDIPPARVTPLLGDSALPPGGMSGGSTGTASAGSAIMIGAAQVIEELQALASSPGAPFEGMEVSYADGRVLANGQAMTFGELLRAVNRPSLSAIGSSSPGEELTKHSFSSFGAQFCEVRVHQWTREARVSRMLGVFDAGRIINDKTARSQLSGGMIWGVSAALHEGLEIERSGRLANGDFAGYLLPVNADIPDIDIHFVEYPDTLHNSVGARGIGEIGIVGTAAAIANAIYNATGIRVRHIPIMVEDLLPD